MSGFTSKRQNRLQSFLGSSARVSDYGLQYGGVLFQQLAAISHQDMTSLVTERYVSTRKIPEGAAQEIAVPLANLGKMPVRGDHVYYLNQWYLEHRDILALWLWAHRNPGARLVIVCDQDPFEIGASDTPFAYKTERDFIPTTQLIEAAATRLNIARSMALRAFDAFLVDSDRRPRKKGETLDRLTLSEADGYLQLLPLLRNTEPGAVMVPRQVAAPLRFDSSSGKIDVLITREHGPKSARIRGAARGALNHAEELLDYPGIENAIPAFKRRLARVIDILGILAAGVEYDDALVVELGAEITGLDSRVRSAERTLGEHTVAEITAFLAVTFALLGQFELWSEYKSTAISTAETDERQAFFLARKILASLSEEPTATGETRERVSAYLAHVVDSDTGLQSKGTTMSAENALASVAAAALEREAGTLGDEVKAKLRDEASTRIKGFIVRNGEIAAKFAIARGAQWLADALRHFGIGA